MSNCYFSDERLLKIVSSILAKQHRGKERHELESALIDWALPVCGRSQALAFAADMTDKVRCQRVY